MLISLFCNAAIINQMSHFRKGIGANCYICGFVRQGKSTFGRHKMGSRMQPALYETQFVTLSDGISQAYIPTYERYFNRHLQG